MSDERKMTIARGLTRLKVIKSQIAQVSTDIHNYGAWNNKKKHPLGDTTHNNLDKNHAQARESIKSLYQKFNDLTNEFIRIKRAIDVANLNTQIEIAGRRMSLHDAIVYEREISKMVDSLVHSYGQAVRNANSDVTNYNMRLSSVPEETKTSVLADVAYLVPKEEIDKLGSFVVEFMSEIDGIKNEINALTEIEIPD